MDAGVVRPQLVPRIVTSLSAAERKQTFDSEDDVGWMYVYATYSNGDAHEVDASDLLVRVESVDRLSYVLQSARHTVGRERTTMGR